MTTIPNDRHRLAARVVGIGSDAPESGGVRQAVVRYAAGRGPQAMAEMRRVLAALSFERTYPRGMPTQVRYALEAERFAGDDALLVRVSERLQGEARDWTDYLTVVRLGDALVTTTHSVGEGVPHRDLALRLAAVGAQRAACLRATC